MANFIADMNFSQRLKELEIEKQRLFAGPADEPPDNREERRLGLVMFEEGAASFDGQHGTAQLQAIKAMVDEAARQGIEVLRLEGYAAVGEKSADGLIDAPMLALRRREYVQAILRGMNYTGTILAALPTVQNIVTAGFCQDYLARRVDVRVVRD